MNYLSSGFENELILKNKVSSTAVGNKIKTISPYSILFLCNSEMNHYDPSALSYSGKNGYKCCLFLFTFLAFTLHKAQ